MRCPNGGRPASYNRQLPTPVFQAGDNAAGEWQITPQVSSTTSWPYVPSLLSIWESRSDCANRSPSAHDVGGAMRPHQLRRPERIDRSYAGTRSGPVLTILPVLRGHS